MTYSVSLDQSHPLPVEIVEESKVKVSDMLLMTFLLLLSGNPFFIGHYDMFVAVSVIIPVYYILTNSNRRVSFKTIFIFTFLLGYELMHAAVYSLDYSLTIFKLFLVLLFAFSVVQILGDRFVRVLTNVMCIFALISFVFTALCYVPGVNWFLFNLGVKLFPFSGESFKHYYTPTLVVYTFFPEYFYGEFSYNRNAGPFWESGAFAVFLNLTLFLRYISKPIVQVKDLFDKKSTLLIIAVLSTTSTMGFLALVVLLTFFTMSLKTALKYVFLLLVIVMSYISFFSVEFLGKKIATQLEESDERNNRFGAAMMDWNDIVKRPLIGSSRRMEVIYGKAKLKNEMRRPNGLTNFFREYGLIYFSVYFMLVFFSFKRIFYYHNYYYNFWFPFFGVVLLWLLSFSELIFDLPFFKSLIFLAVAYMPFYRPEHEEALEKEIAV